MTAFKTILLEEALDFLRRLERKTTAKVLYNIQRAEAGHDPELFKKLQGEIWEFRTQYLGLQIRLLAFWDKEDKDATLVLATHGFIKKVSKVPKNELEKAAQLRERYFKQKAGTQTGNQPSKKKQ